MLSFKVLEFVTDSPLEFAQDNSELFSGDIKDMYKPKIFYRMLNKLNKKPIIVRNWGKLNIPQSIIFYCFFGLRTSCLAELLKVLANLNKLGN